MATGKLGNFSYKNSQFKSLSSFWSLKRNRALSLFCNDILKVKYGRLHQRTDKPVDLDKLCCFWR